MRMMTSGLRARKFLLHVLVAIITLFLSACTQYIRPDHLSDDPLVYLARIAAQHDLVDRLAMDVRASVSSSVVGADANLILVARRPHDIRVEVLTPTDDLVAIMTANETTFVHYERGAAVCYTGPPCVENTARLLPIPIKTVHLIELLLGGAPILVRGVPAVQWDPWSGYQQLRVSHGGGAVQQISFDPCTLNVRRMELFQDGILTMRVENDDWDSTTGVSLPKSIRLAFPEQNLDAAVNILAVDPRIPLDPTAFRFVCPLGVDVISLPCSK